MPKYEVTMAETTYETYTVEAENAASAREMVQNGAVRANLPSRPDGGANDETWVATREVL